MRVQRAGVAHLLYRDPLSSSLSFSPLQFPPFFFSSFLHGGIAEGARGKSSGVPIFGPSIAGTCPYSEIRSTTTDDRYRSRGRFPVSPLAPFGRSIEISTLVKGLAHTGCFVSLRNMFSEFDAASLFSPQSKTQE